MAAERCVFADQVPVDWSGPAADPVAPSLSAPFVVADLTVSPFDASSVSAVASVVAGSTDAQLVGEHQNRPDYPPTLMAALVRAAGGTPWLTLTCRDRNRVVLEQEARGLALAGAAAVLCVTGDGRAIGVRPDVTQVFDVDSTQLTSLVSSHRLPVAVAESPQAEPTQHRAARVLVKQHAGASVCILNHVRSPSALEEFVRRAREVGVTIPFVAGVAVYTDERSARVLQAFPGLHLDDGRVERVLRDRDPLSAGIDAAVEEASDYLAIDGVMGVNLSGLGSSQDVLVGAQVKAEVARRIKRAA